MPNADSPLAPLLSRLNRSRLWHRRVVVDGRPMRASSADRLLYLVLNRLRLIGQEERAFLLPRLAPGMKVADVGANVGVYTRLFAQRVGPSGAVYAFEPDAGLFGALSENCRDIAPAPVRAFDCALGSINENRVLYRSPLHSGDNRLLAQQGQGGTEVRVRRLDDVLDGVTLDFVKIDVQGWELEVLKGMEGTLRQRPPPVFLEFWPHGLRRAGCRPEDVPAFLAGMGFSIHVVERGAARVITDFAALTRSLTGGRFVNLFAIPPHAGGGGLETERTACPNTIR